MNNITNYNELMVEKQRLKLLLEERKILVQTEFEEIKLKLKPVGHVIEVVEKFTSRDKHNPLVNIGIDVGVNFLLKRVLLRNAGLVAKIVLPFITKNYLSHQVDEEDNIFNKIGGLIKKAFKRSQPE